MLRHLLPYFCVLCAKSGGFVAPCVVKRLVVMRECVHCGGDTIKYGLRGGVQRYRCKSCLRSVLHSYKKKAYEHVTNRWIVGLTLESCGIRGTGRLLCISPKTVLSRIEKIASGLRKPSFPWGMEYEADEMKVFVEKEQDECWISYALECESRKVVDVKVGRRIRENISMVAESILAYRPKRVYTDGLNTYRGLIPKSIHKVGSRRINHIERRNLDLRHSLKRLSRKTIAYTKKIHVLESILKIYFWYDRSQLSVNG